MIVAGGTGGHVYPGLAVAQALQEKGIELYWMGTRRGLEARVVPQHGLPLCPILVSGLRRSGILRWLAAPVSLSVALLQAVRAIVRTKPRVVLGMGGFVSGPGGVAAWLCRRPLIIHEQNSVAGLTNRVLSRIAGQVLEAFPGSFPAAVKALTTGNPVRAEITRIETPVERMGHRESVNILVFGGSRGAHALNEHVPAAIHGCAVPGLCVRHQCGADDVDATSGRYRVCTNIEDVQVEAYIDDMASAYRWADLVIARSGALTVAEIAACGVASILIPYPHAVDDHQTLNARYLSERGAAILLPEGEMTIESLGAHLDRVLGDRAEMMRMATNARELGRPHATDEVATHCLEFIDA